jgi:predicted MPP superfamily phosphohydrolase
MRVPRFSRRKFIATALFATPGVVAADAKWFEPTWLKVRHVRIGSGKPEHRFVHFTDIHHKGDRDYLKAVVNCINSLAPDFVCFTGDIIEEEKYLGEALEHLSAIKAPLFGVPGNHDYWSNASFAPIHECFNASGGAWLLDEQRKISVKSNVNIIGITCSHDNQAKLPLDPSLKNILLMHYPAWAKKLGEQKFDLILAGHSHGGQVRIPFFGPVVVPYAVDEYDIGLFQIPQGPLYVNPGIGYIYNYKFRFNCRPEITVIEI